MAQTVLVIGGNGRIGKSAAADIVTYTDATVTVTGRQPNTIQDLLPHQSYLSLDLADEAGVERAIAQHDLIVHCAGPFRSRNHHVLTSCIAQ
ncbi:MAG: saccharopine dehydrogenase NADP-binding domain-containing protein, partial [Cyanobacteria bacterium J06560_6]